MARLGSASRAGPPLPKELLARALALWRPGALGTKRTKTQCSTSTIYTLLLYLWHPTRQGVGKRYNSEFFGMMLLRFCGYLWKSDTHFVVEKYKAGGSLSSVRAQELSILFSISLFQWKTKWYKMSVCSSCISLVFTHTHEMFLLCCLWFVYIVNLKSEELHWPIPAARHLEQEIIFLCIFKAFSIPPNIRPTTTPSPSNPLRKKSNPRISSTRLVCNERYSGLKLKMPSYVSWDWGKASFVVPWCFRLWFQMHICRIMFNLQIVSGSSLQSW